MSKMATDTGFVPAFRAAQDIGTTSQLAWGLQATQFPIDPKWESNPQRTKRLIELSKGIDDPRRVERIFASTSEDEANYIAQQMRVQQDAAQTIAASGKAGIAGSIAAGITDPVLVTAGIATGGVGAGYFAAGQTALGIASSGASQAALFGGLAVLRAGQDPTMTARDIATEVVGGAAGGVAGPAFASTGRAARFAIAGGAAGAGNFGTNLAANYLNAENDTDRSFSEMLGDAAIQMIAGGALNAIHAKVDSTGKTIRVADPDMHAAAVRMVAPPTPENSQALFGTLLKQSFDIEDGDIPTVQPAATVAAETPLPRGTFKTSMGSTYEFDGVSTVRNKTAHAGHGGSDVGVKAKSEKTYFIDQEAAREAGVHQTLSGKPAVVVRDEASGPVAYLAAWNDEANKWGIAPQSKPIKLQQTPSIGSHPLEVWSGKDSSQGRVYTSWHPGNDIVAQALQFDPAALVAAPPAATPIPSTPGVPTTPEMVVGGAALSPQFAFAQGVTRVAKDVLPGDFDASAIGAERPAFTLGKWSNPIDFHPGRVVGKSSESPEVVGVMNRLVDDPLLRTDVNGKPVEKTPTADVWSQRNIRAESSVADRILDENFGEYLQRAPNGNFEEFDRQVWFAGRLIDREVPAAQLAETFDPAVIRVAQEFKNQRTKYAAIRGRHNEPGFRPTDGEDAGNLQQPQKWNREAVDRVLNLAENRDEVVDGIAKAIRAKSGDGEDVSARIRTLADTILRNGGTRNELDSIFTRNRWTETQRDSLIRAARASNAPESIVDELLFLLRKDTGEAGTTTSRKARIDIDETTRFTFKGRDGKDYTFAIADLLETSAREAQTWVISDSYRRAGFFETVRASGMSDNLNVDNDVRTPEQLRARLASILKEPDLIDRESANLQRIEIAAREVLGINPIPQSDSQVHRMVWQTAHMIGSASSHSLLADPNQSIMNVAGELSGAAAQAGFTTIIKTIPETAQILKDIRTIGRGFKESDSQLIKEIQAIVGAEESRRPNLLETAFNDDAYAYSPGRRGEQVVKSLNRIVGKYGRISQTYSGQAFTTAAMKYVSAHWAAQRILDGKFDGPAFYDLGVSVETAQRMSDEIRKHATINDRGVIVGLNREKWDDYVSAQFFDTINTAVERAVQSNNPTQIPVLFKNNLGRLLIRLRSFGVQAMAEKMLYTGNSLRNGRWKDWRFLAKFVQSNAFTLLGAAAVTYIRSLTQEDPEAYRRERLTPAELGKAMISRSVYTGLIPAYVDAAYGMANRPAPFARGRVSGIGTQGGRLSVFTSTVAGDRFNTMFRAADSAIRPALDSEYDFSKQDLRNVAKGLFLDKAFGLTDILVRLAPLPERSRQEGGW